MYQTEEIIKLLLHKFSVRFSGPSSSLKNYLLNFFARDAILPIFTFNLDQAPKV